MASRFSQDSLKEQEDFSHLISGELMDKMSARIVFSPGETISTLDRIIVLGTVDSTDNEKKVERGRLVRVISHEYGARRIDASTFEEEGEPSYTTELIRNPETGIASRQPVLPKFVKYAKESADELRDAYKERGVVILEPLTGIGREALAEIEQILLPVDSKEGGIKVPEDLLAFAEWLDKAENQKLTGVSPEIRRKIGETIALMSQAVSQAISYQSSVTGKIETELFNRRHTQGAQGIPQLDSVHKHYFRMLRTKPTDQHMTDLSERANSALMSALAVNQGPIVTARGATCQYCGSNISEEAVKCPICHEWLDDAAELAYNEKQLKKGKKSKEE